MSLTYTVLVSMGVLLFAALSELDWVGFVLPVSVMTSLGLV